jgi:hypothetical protein
VNFWVLTPDRSREALPMEATTEIPLTRRREVSEEREGILSGASSNRRKTAMQTPRYAAEIISDAGKSEGPRPVYNIPIASSLDGRPPAQRADQISRAIGGGR